MPPSESEQSFVKIAVVENAIEAELLSSFLTQLEIPHRLRSYHDTAYDGLFQFQKGWGEVLGPPDYRQQIREALSDLRSHSVDDLEDEPED
jgi:hypothetical protein